MDWILNGIFKTFIGWITSVLDIYFSAILGALGVNLSVFESVFPLVKKLSIGIMAIASVSYTHLTLPTTSRV